MDDQSPPRKRVRLDDADSNTENSLENRFSERLKDSMKCTVCHVMKPDQIMQCNWGHIMCESCIFHLMADAMLRHNTAKCPSCRRPINWQKISRNLPMQQTLCELPTNCHQCQQQMEYKNVESHLAGGCENRIVNCKYNYIGCNWSGAYKESQAHVEGCVQPQMSGNDLLKYVEEAEKRQKHKNCKYRLVYKMLSSSRIHYEDLQLSLQRSQSGHSILFSSRRFFAFEESWVVRARVNNGNPHPEVSPVREMFFNLVLCSESPDPLSLQYFVTKGSRVPLNISMHVYQHCFVGRRKASGYKNMTLANTTECNRLLSYKSFFLRIWMFIK